MLEQIVSGLVSGSMYALVALGFTLVFGVLERLNFAHTEVFMFGGYAGLIGFGLGLPLLGAILFATIVAGAMGFAVEFICFRRGATADSHVAAALSSLAVGLVILEVTEKFWGTEPRAIGIDHRYLVEGVSVLGMHLSYVKLLILGMTLVLAAGLHFLIERTQTGRNIRAVAESPDFAALLGVNVRRVVQQTFFIASALAGIAGLLLSLKNGIVTPGVGLVYGLKALAVMAIGGLGDLRGAVAAGLIVGVAEALAYQFGMGQIGELIVWLLMILVLLFRPSGLFGARYLTKARA